MSRAGENSDARENSSSKWAALLVSNYLGDHAHFRFPSYIWLSTTPPGVRLSALESLDILRSVSESQVMRIRRPLLDGCNGKSSSKGFIAPHAHHEIR